MTLADTSMYDIIPAPSVRHLVIDDLKGKRAFVIGDVHGCLTEVKALLKKAKLMSENGKVINDALIIFAGDFVQKGPYNIETLRFIKSSGAYAVRGNNEEKVLLRYFCKKNGLPIEKMKNRYGWEINLTESDIEFLCELPYSISIPSLKSIVVHAGLLPHIPLEEQSSLNMTTLRRVMEVDGNYIAEDDNESNITWAEVWKGPEHVYYGHQNSNERNCSKFATCLDTDCVYGGALTGIFISGPCIGQFVTVKPDKPYKNKNQPE